MFSVASRRILFNASSLPLRLCNRTLSTTRISYNVIQDLYLRELKETKLPPTTLQDAEGNVKPWMPPKKPSLPELELQGPDALKAYTEQKVETAHVAEESAEGGSEPIEEDWLVLDDAEEAKDSH
ncbi:atp14p [Saccharomyces arboricola H-6]|uniref:Atp14p n=1 Tax=Saccharomyces arboricola (strain H-6 / AS 2.3317 / CBS 10644) TaxID=1160507 RepID=J8PYV1_SACAR|nr:atp14p [Saccharomyces arboricola H-6]